MALGFLSTAGSFLKTAAPFISLAGALSGGGQRKTLTRVGDAAAGFGSGGTNIGQQTARDVSPDQPAETSTSGSTDGQNLIINLGDRTSGGIVPASFRNTPNIGAGMGRNQGGSIQPAFSPVFGGAAKFLFGSAVGMLAPMIIDPLTGQEKKLRVTRRLRSQVKKAVEFFGVEAVAEQMGVEVEIIFFILTKRIRNDGPAITKAALRKTRSTLRKLDAMCDMRDKMRPPARRAPRARTTSKVMQIKN